VRFDEHGDGAPTLVLLHGMASTGRVWDLVVERLAWPGRIVVPDLPGHGRSRPSPPYSFGSMAADVAAVVGRDSEVVAVGHSLGGVVALALGSGWFGCPVRTVVAMSVKVRWSPEDLARAAAIASRPVTWFDDESAAVDRALRVAGLAGLVDPSSPMATAGVVADGCRFRLAHDPATADLGAPDIAGLVAACRARVVLGCGSEDPMVGHAELVGFDPAAFVLEGIGHNAHVEAPDLVAGVITAL
jgi:pimeloyl-ACP methyl ester carboxylesterase